MWKFFDRLKTKDSLFSNSLKVLYKIGKIEWFSHILITGITLSIPIFYQYSNFTWFYIFIALFVLYTVYYNICIKYEKHSMSVDSRFLKMLSLSSEAISSLNYYVERDNNWQDDIYQKACEVVSTKIKSFFSEELKIETRISVEDVKIDKITDKKTLRMFGRQSRARTNVSRIIDLDKKKKYFIYKTFKNGNSKTNILKDLKNNEEWFNNLKHNVDVKEYWGIVNYDEKNDCIRFVFEIDFLNETGMSDDDIQNFIQIYLGSFIQIIRMAYLLNKDI